MSGESVLKAMKKGFCGACPRCGQGRLFESFLKVDRRCAQCGLPFHHQRADDFPPYLVIFIVGHIIVSLVMLVEARWDLSVALHLAIWFPLALVMALALLQPVKGAVIGLQWALKMHGFSETDS